MRSKKNPQFFNTGFLGQYLKSKQYDILYLKNKKIETIETIGKDIVPKTLLEKPVEQKELNILKCPSNEDHINSCYIIILISCLYSWAE